MSGRYTIIENSESWKSFYCSRRAVEMVLSHGRYTSSMLSHICIDFPFRIVPRLTICEGSREADGTVDSLVLDVIVFAKIQT